MKAQRSSVESERKSLSRHGQTVIPSLLTMLLLPLIFQPTLAEEEFVDQAVPKKNLYSPVSTDPTPWGTTVPFSTYPLVVETQNGFIFRYDKAPASPPYAFITKFNRLSNPSAKVCAKPPGLAIEIQSQTTEPIHPGYIPFLTNIRYPVIKQEGTNLFLKYVDGNIVATAAVSAADCTVVRASTVREEHTQQEAAKSEKLLKEQADVIEKVIAYSRSEVPYEKKLSTLKTALERFPTHPSIGSVKKRLEDLTSPGYLYVKDALAEAAQKKKHSESITLIEAALQKHPNTDLTTEAERQIAEYRSKSSYYLATIMKDVSVERHDVEVLNVHVDCLKEAIARFVCATNLADAKRLLAAKMAALEEARQMTAAGKVRHRGNWADVDTARQECSVDLASAMDRAPKCRTIEEAIELVSQAIENNPAATNTVAAQEYLAALNARRRELLAEQERQQKEEWRRQDLARQQENQRILGAGGGGWAAGHFGSPQAAWSAAEQRNAMCQGTMDSAREMSINTRSSMTLSSAFLPRWTVTRCSEHESCWILIQK